jgi:hypothetical protein
MTEGPVQPGQNENPDFKAPEPGQYAHLLDPNAPQPSSVEDAAVRQPNIVTPAKEVDRQMSIDAADRKSREEAGLPPRTYDLR